MKLTKKQLLKKIVAARKSAGVSQTAAAKLTQGASGWKARGLQVSQSAWFRIEEGQRVPTWDSLFLMAEAIGLDIAVQITSRDQ